MDMNFKLPVSVHFHWVKAEGKQEPAMAFQCINSWEMEDSLERGMDDVADYLFPESWFAWNKKAGEKLEPAELQTVPMETISQAFYARCSSPEDRQVRMFANGQIHQTLDLRSRRHYVLCGDFSKRGGHMQSLLPGLLSLKQAANLPFQEGQTGSLSLTHIP